MPEQRTGAVDPPGLDLTRFETFFESVRPGAVTAPLRAEVIAGGKSNLTYEVTDGEHRWIVRRPPLGHVLATAHDMAREYRVITALAADRRPGARDVRPVRGPRRARRAVLRDGAGRRGRRTGSPRQLEPARGRAHRRDLGPDGRHPRRAAPRRPGGGRARRLRPSGGLPGPPGAALGQAARRARGAGSCPGPTSCSRASRSACPRSPRPAIVHGDYRLDNLLVDDGDRVGRGARLGDGHPRRPAHRPGAAAGLPDAWPRRDSRAAPSPTRPGPPGFLHDDAMLERYAAGSDRDLSDIGWYLGLGLLQARGHPRGHPLPLHARADRRRRASTGSAPWSSR